MVGEGDGELLFKGHRVSVWKDEQVLEMESGDGYTTLQIYIMPLNCALKNGENGKF